LADGDWKPLAVELQEITLPAFIPVNTIGIDGVTRGVDVGSYMRSCSFAWWGDAPAQWQDLSAWHAKAVRHLQKFLPQSTVQLPDDL
jgi:hypothetical protein